MKKILIANRGEIASRIIHTAHRMGIETVAVYSDPDANALHVREATQAVALGGAASADTYLRIDKLLGACLLYTSPSPRDVEESRMPSSA